MLEYIIELFELILIFFVLAKYLSLKKFKMATMTEQVSKLLDFSQKLDITLLENIVGCMYTGTGDQVSF